jgi:hypothetical protein
VERGSWVAPFYVTAAVLASGSLIWVFLIDPEKSVVEVPDRIPRADHRTAGG